MRIVRTFIPLLSLTSILVSCGGGGSSACSPAAQTGCDDGFICEEVTGGEPTCFAPIEVRGSVFDLADDGVIEGARLVALDANGAARSGVAVSGVDGAYLLHVSAARDAEGLPSGQVTLRADAAGYQSFPGGVRQALPIDLGTATLVDGRYQVASVQTDVGLLALQTSAAGRIHGHVEVGDHTGVLVVAESDGAVVTAVADRDGDYVIFNVPDGSYQVQGYVRGLVYAPTSAEVSGGSDELADLDLVGEATSTVTGQLQFPDAGGAGSTSVILVVAATFSEALGRGETPAGLRLADVTGDFTLEGVPPGRYAVLAAFENDGLVRDPDFCISGTDTVFVDVVDGQPADLPESFKVTGALDIFGPDAAEPVTGNPVFSWNDDSSEEEYVVEVYDSFGVLVWSHIMEGVSGSDPELTYAGPTLTPGMYYQFRVLSQKLNPETCPISRTEDLRGVFVAQ
jgi:hypothetical protein